MKNKPDPAPLETDQKKDTKISWDYPFNERLGGASCIGFQRNSFRFKLHEIWNLFRYLYFAEQTGRFAKISLWSERSSFVCLIIFQ
jgi:hypothetical protein